jgi:hypothetical protein
VSAAEYALDVENMIIDDTEACLLSQQTVLQWCRDNDYGHVETSAKDGSGVHVAMQTIAALALQAYRTNPTRDRRAVLTQSAIDSSSAGNHNGSGSSSSGRDSSSKERRCGSILSLTGTKTVEDELVGSGLRYSGRTDTVSLERLYTPKKRSGCENCTS